MNKEADWTRRTPQIRSALSAVRCRFIDRRQLEQLFGVSSYQARRLIGRMGPMLHGNSLVVDPEDILKLLSDVERDREMHDLRVQLAEASAKLEPDPQDSKPH
jgi:hypothetical protein